MLCSYLMRVPRNSSQYYRYTRRKWIKIFLVLLTVGIFIYPIRHSLIINFYLYLGKKQIGNGEYTRALNTFQKTVTINPRHALAHDALGMAYSYLGKREEAEKEYQNALQLGIKYQRWFDHIQSGDQLLARGKYLSAQVEYRHASRLQKNRASAYFGLGATYHALGDFPQAINQYRKSLTLDPNFATAQQLLEVAVQERKRGITHYLFDCNGEVLGSRIHRQSQYYYPYGSITAHPLGFSHPELGSMGLGKKISDLRMGNKIYLTLDCHLQVVASRALGWYRGAIIILNPQTGEILALVSQPGFNPNRLKRDWKKIQNHPHKPLLNRVLEKTYCPGSLAHIVTLAAALEEEKVLSEIFPFQCRGRLEEEDMQEGRIHGKIESLEEAFQEACSLAFARTGIHLGAHLISEYTERLGWGPEIWESEKEFPLPVISGSIPFLPKENTTLLARTAGGMEDQCQITPLTGALTAAVIANNGLLMKPYLIKEIKNITGQTFQAENPRVLKRVLKPETALRIKELMVATVDSGIARLAKTKKVTIAGRTATVKSGENEIAGWFIGFAPAEKPTIAFAIVVERGSGPYTAAAIARKIVETIL